MVQLTKEYDDWIYSQYEDAQFDGYELMEDKGWID